MNQPMTLANMRENGVYSVIAICVACGHRVNVNIDALPETIAVPEAGLQLRCGQCGGNRINTQPAGFMAPGNFGRERARA